MIDGTAAGRGWFIDPTPQDSSEFTARRGVGVDSDAVEPRLRAGGPADGRHARDGSRLGRDHRRLE